MALNRGAALRHRRPFSAADVLSREGLRTAARTASQPAHVHASCKTRVQTSTCMTHMHYVGAVRLLHVAAVEQQTLG